MRKKFYISILILVLCINMSGCGKINNTNTDNSKLASSEPTSNIEVNNTPSSETSDNTALPSVLDNKKEQEPTTEPNEKTKIEIISSQKTYSDASRTVKFLGLKEYSKIEGETYTDTPKKGNIYLVLFLSIKNDTNEENYINYNYLKAKVDGKNIEHTFLLNNPKNYPTIFTKIQAGGAIAGFIVWEVPNNWKKFQIIYNGWKVTDNISLKGKFTKKDLTNPIIYNANNYINVSQGY